MSEWEPFNASARGAVRGFLSPYFVTDAERMEVVLEDPYILIHEKKISNMKDLLPLQNDMSVQIPCEPGKLPATPEEAAKLAGARTIRWLLPAAATGDVYAYFVPIRHANIFRIAPM